MAAAGGWTRTYDPALGDDLRRTLLSSADLGQRATPQAGGRTGQPGRGDSRQQRAAHRKWASAAVTAKQMGVNA